MKDPSAPQKRAANLKRRAAEAEKSQWPTSGYTVVSAMTDQQPKIVNCPKRGRIAMAISEEVATHLVRLLNGDTSDSATDPTQQPAK